MYHVHGLEGYRKESYVYVGEYRFKWIANHVAEWFVAKHPYGQAVVTKSDEKPLIK